VLHSHQLLAEHSAQQHGELRKEQTARSVLEERLVEADRRGMLGELAATIAHDLRNPLTVVKGSVESLCRRPRTPDEVAQHRDVIRRNIDKADRTIESLIDLARPQAAEPTELRPTAALAEVRDLLAVEARRLRVALDVVYDESEQGVLRADHTLLAQALINLALNALQAAPAGSAVRLGARRVRDRIAIVVEDRGVGLPDGVRSRLFTPFFTTKPNGTGLGLPSCRRIANELGGDLRLYPRTRGGARALLLLPAAGAAAGLPAKAVAADESSRWPATTC
jgi:two-component system sensor histidine kinase AtoS